MNSDDIKYGITYKIKACIKKYCPNFSLVFFCICLLALTVHVVCLISSTFADFYNQTVGSAVRALLAYLTMFLPFSLAETVIIALPVLLFVIHILKIALTVLFLRDRKRRLLDVSWDFSPF